MTPTRRLAAIMAADVAGFSAAMERDEEGTFARVHELRRKIIEPKIAEHQGRLIKTTGDGFLAEFASPLAATRAALAIQAEALSGALQLRIGINLGDVIVEESGDVYGDGVNVAARLEGLAEPGGILVSDKILREVEGKIDVAFEDRGDQHVKNISKPVHAYAARNASSRLKRAATAETKPLTLPDKPSIAVLPFQNMSGDHEQEYFADGVVEDIITALSRFRSLFVIARNSSFAYKGKSPDIRLVGRELGVRYVLEGSVRKSANRVRITGQLIDTLSGAHLWADRFEGTLEDVFALQDRVTASVVGVIAPKIEQAEIERAKYKPTEQLDSYDFYLRGMALYYKRQFEPARELFKKAYERDPDYAAAYAMAAYMFGTQRGVAGQKLTDDMLAEALKLTNIAAGLANEDAFVLARCGHAFVFFGRDYERGMSMVEQAVALNSNLSVVWSSLGWVSLICGQAERAIEGFQNMLRLSPVDSLRVFTWSGIAWAHWAKAQYGEGRVWAIKGMRENTNANSLCAYILNSVGAGFMAEARSAVAEVLKFDTRFSITRALDLVPFRPTEFREKVVAALREVGLPE
jgi:TolB-like protein/Tfp pilus assembly protein PilF